MKPRLFALSLPPRLCLLIFNVHTVVSDPVGSSPPHPPPPPPLSLFQSCHGYNGDCGLEVNDPVAPSLGRRSLPRSGLGTVPPLRSSQEAPKTVVTARLRPRDCSRGSAKEGLAGFPLLFPPKLHTLEFKRRRRRRRRRKTVRRRVERWPGSVGQAGTWTDD